MINHLRIIKAIYYVPEIGAENGTDVTVQISAQIVDDRLFYNGIYNYILPDHFKKKYKKLRLEIQYRNKEFIKEYSEDEKINLPQDLGESATKSKYIPNIPHYFSDAYATKNGIDKITGNFSKYLTILELLVKITPILVFIWAVYTYFHPSNTGKDLFSRSDKNIPVRITYKSPQLSTQDICDNGTCVGDYSIIAENDNYLELDSSSCLSKKPISYHYDSGQNGKRIITDTQIETKRICDAIALPKDLILNIMKTASSTQSKDTVWNYTKH